ncbi:LysR substrate-binding domain-containing protein [Nitrospirillum pindoramense]|uniref:LysR family transcriptional regulator n=1 Tax=Nitrospirillum amazonense TaxID=28077 RepID=A0A560GVQ1_9PROT|nr:LysR substrate-binding domain-containing protein [Nitrospirillum amazonense]TWB37669.1 LysR family transcriptional regulator [Nitrospirillum amazonense]
MLELKLLRSFVLLAEELHFGRAAERLHIVQPALTQQIQSLERQIGTQLLNRTRGRISLTDAGVLVLAEARKTLEQAARTETIGRLAGRGEVGRLEVGFVGSAGLSALMPAVLRDFRQAHPGVDLNLVEMAVGPQLAAIAAGDVDVGFIRLPPLSLPGGVAVLPLRPEGLVVALPAGHPLAQLPAVPVAGLAREPMVLHHRAAAAELRSLIDELCARHGFAPQVVQSVPQISLTIRLVAAGLGVSLMPETIASMAVEGVVYRPLADDDIHYTLALAHRAQDAAPAVRAFVALAGALAEP